MRGRGLARGLALFSGALIGLLVISNAASASALPAKSSRGGAGSLGTDGGGVQGRGGGLHSLGRLSAPPGPLTGGGGSPPIAVAGQTSSALQPITSSMDVPSTNSAAVVPSSPRQLPLRTQSHVPTVAPVTVASHGSGTAIIGQNSSDFAVAISGDVVAVNTAIVSAGPTAIGGSASQVGNNVITVNQNLIAIGGDAIAGSTVIGAAGFGTGLFGTSSHSGFGVHPLHGFIHDDDLFDSPFFWGHHSFFHHSLADLHRAEILAEMLDDCLDRLSSHFSHARLHICEHIAEQLSESRLLHGSFDFHGGFLFGGFGHFGFSGGAIINTGGVHALIGPTGVIVSGPGGNVMLGATGLIADIPHGRTSSGSGAAVLLFAPFGFGFHHFFGHHFDHGFLGHHHHGLVGHLHDAGLGGHHWRPFGWGHFGTSVIRTLHFHSDWWGLPWWFHGGFFSPFGHRTVLATDHSLLVSGGFFGNSIIASDDSLLVSSHGTQIIVSGGSVLVHAADDCWDHHHHHWFHHNHHGCHLFGHLGGWNHWGHHSWGGPRLIIWNGGLFFVADTCFHRRPVLDLPGLTIGASGHFGCGFWWPHSFWI